MTPEEKAKELYKKFRGFGMIEGEHIGAKQCALICVDEILEVEDKKAWGCYNTITYYQKVKQEIEKL